MGYSYDEGIDTHYIDDGQYEIMLTSDELAALPPVKALHDRIEELENILDEMVCEHGFHEEGTQFIRCTCETCRRADAALESDDATE